MYVETESEFSFWQFLLSGFLKTLCFIVISESPKGALGRTRLPGSPFIILSLA